MAHKESKINHPPDSISSGLLIVLAIAIWWLSGHFPNLEEGYPGPNLFPRIIAVGLGIIGIIIFIDSFRLKSITHNASKVLDMSHPLRLSLGVSLMILFPLLAPLIGFLPSLLITSIAMGLTFQLVWWKAVLTGLVTVSGVYIIFSFFLGVML